MDAPTSQCHNGNDIASAYVALCTPHGPVEGIRLFCHQDQPGETLCMIEMGSGAKNAAVAVGGWAYGTTVCVRRPLPEGFHCRYRRDGKLFIRSCDDCHLAVGATEQQSAEPRATESRVSFTPSLAR